MADAFVQLASYVSEIEAQIARTRLESEGVYSHIRDAGIVGSNWTLSNAVGGVKLFVKTEDAERARELLNITVEPNGEDEGWGACPNCGSRKITVRTDTMWAAISWMLMGLPIVTARSRLVCLNCQAVFKRSEAK